MFEQVGYREGITAGKEAALQEGFDEGFAQTGVPIGRRIGLLRGTSSVLLSILTSQAPLPHILAPERNNLATEARDISSRLNEIRFSDIAPPDLDAEQHAREHLDSAEGDDRDMDIDLSDELTSKREVESLEDMMNRMGAGSLSAAEKKGRPTTEDVAQLAERLVNLANRLGLSMPLPAS